MTPRQTSNGSPLPAPLSVPPMTGRHRWHYPALSAVWQRAQDAVYAAAVSRQVWFALVGAGVMLVGLVVLYALVEVVGLAPNTAKMIELIISIQLNFFGNRYFTWRDRAGTGGIGGLLRFNLSRLVTVALSWVIFATLAQHLGTPYLVA